MPFCNEFGQPDPNGSFELIGGKICLRDGAKVQFRLAHMQDSLSAKPIFLTDVVAPDSGSTQLADAESALVVARAKMIHDQTHAWMGARAPAFADAEANRALADEGQRRQRTTAPTVDAQAAQTRAADAYAQMVEDQGNAWRTSPAR